MTPFWTALSLWAVVWSLLDFCLMGIDKRRAKRHTWRIRERTFFLVALLGGTPGALLGMYLFHHKTRHWYFRFGLPALLLLQIGLVLWLAKGW